ncbi:Gfo/Idh/MocA family protein [Thermopirellula anaerolimosa]
MRFSVGLFSALAVCASAMVNASLLWGEETSAKPKPLRAGLIGLDTSHVLAFTDLINDPAAEGVLAEVEVTAGFPGGSPDLPASWDRVEEYTAKLREKGVTIYESIEAMLPHVDVVLVESVDGRPHLEQARKVIAAKKPLYIDKPMAASLVDVLKIFRLADDAGVPVFSSSSLRFSSGFQAARRGELPIGTLRKCTAWSPMHIEPHHPDLFWYGVHGVETLYTIMGPGCKTVVREGPERVVGTWSDGRIGVFEARQGYGAEVEGTEGTASAGTYEGYKPLVVEICRFFKTGVSPVPREETIELFAFMEAADESTRLGGKPVEIADILKRAEATAADTK